MELLEVAKFFEAHNRSRTERLLELAPAEHQSFLQLLPLIFHSNDAALPSYIEGAPHGIVNYSPSDQLLATAKKFHPTLSYTKKSYRQYPIQGVYLINELGSLKYPHEPRFDLWLVYSSDITDEQTSALKAKLQSVVKVAKSIGIRLNARLLNDTAVKEHKITADDLDRLYLSGLILGGCLPAWWFISPEQDQDYTHHTQQLLANPPKEFSLLDFGPLTKRNPAAVVDTAIKASLSAMQVGLPSFVELLYQQTLIAKFTDDNWLSPRYKQAIYSHESNTFLCEPLLIKFDLLSEKLAPSLLPYLRQSLYLQCGERLSVNVNMPRFPWRRESILDLVNEWQWEREQLVELDQRKQSPIRQRLAEFGLSKTLLKALNDTIFNFARSSVPDAAKKVLALKKAYQGLFEQSPDVIPRMPDAFIPESSEETIYIEYDNAGQRWQLSEMDRDKLKKGEVYSPLYTHDAVVPLIAWAILNGGLSKFSRVKITANQSDTANDSVYGLIDHLVQSPVADKQSADTDLTWLMLANSEQNPEEAYKQQDMKLALRLRDPLNYGYHRRNLILSLEALVCADGKSWHYLSFPDDKAISEGLASLVRWQSKVDQNNDIECWCATPQFAQSISKRLKALGQGVVEYYQSTAERGTYLLEIGDKLCRIQWQDQQVDATNYARRHDIDTILAISRTELSPTHVDELLDYEGLYKLLLTAQSNNHIRVFVDEQRKQLNVYVLDELGHLNKLKPTNLKETTLLANLDQFLSALPAAQSGKKPLFYKLHNINGSWTLKPLALPKESSSTKYLPVKINLKTKSPDAECIIKCGPKSFSGRANDSALFNETSQYILSLRTSSNAFPVYITELAFKASTQTISSNDHLIFKQHIENLLNAG